MAYGTNTPTEVDQAELDRLRAEQERADEMAAGLRRLADTIAAHPELWRTLRYALGDVKAPVSHLGDARSILAAWARAGKESGAVIAKDFDGTWSGVHVDFGGLVGLYVYADRAQVCEKVVTGTREITERVPDPEALAAVPRVEQTRTEEIVEWRCRPLLADDEDQAVGDEAAAVTA